MNPDAPTRSIAELPGPPRLPLLGNAHRVRTATLHLVAERWADQYGSVFRFDLGKRPIVTVSDADEINRMLRERPAGFRRWREVLQNATEMTGTIGVFAAEGENWRHQRRLAVTALNSNHLQRYFQIIQTATQRLHRRLASAADTGQILDIGQELASFTVDVTSALAFGHDLNTLERGESELQGHIQRVFATSARRLIVPIPYWRWFKLPADRAVEHSLAAIQDAVSTFMQDARQRIAARPELRDAPENFLEGMIAAQETDGSFTDQEIIGNVFTLLLAGEDTTAHTIAWTIWLMASRPEQQSRWAAEACELLGEEHSPADYATTEQLHYGEAVLRESMRLKPVAPVLGLEPLADTTVAGTQIPAGTRILLLNRRAGLQAVPRAHEFDPQRWLGGDSEENAAPDQKSFLGFGAGPRFCPGRNLAFLESKTALAMIARNFELELDHSQGPVTEVFSFTMVPQGLRVRLRQRAPHSASAAGAASAVVTAHC
jgi:cytochrome P450